MIFDLLFGAVRICATEAATAIVQECAKELVPTPEMFAFQVNMGRRVVNLISPSVYDLRQQISQITRTYDFHLTCGTSVLSNERDLSLYGLQRYPRTNKVQCSLHLKGGGPQEVATILTAMTVGAALAVPLEPTTCLLKVDELADEIFELLYPSTYTGRFDDALLPTRQQRFLKQKRMRKLRKRCWFHVQQSEFDHYEMQSGDSFGKLLGFLRKSAEIADKKAIDLLEAVVLTLVSCSRARDALDVTLAVTSFIKMTTTRSIIGASVECLVQAIEALILQPEIQSNFDAAVDAVGKMRSVIENWETYKDSDMGKRTQKVAVLLVNHGVFSSIGVKPDHRTRKYMECDSGWSDGADFCYTVFDFTTVAIQRALLYAKTGDWEIVLHGRRSYQQWYDKCLELKRLSESMSNLEPHGTSYFQFVSDLEDVIEQGKAIVRYANKDYEARFLRSLLNDMLIMKTRNLTLKAAQQERKAPFGLLVFGGSSVGKSSFTKMLYYYYGNIMGLPIGDEYRYVRNPADEYWSGFVSYKWCIQLDDIGYLAPNATTVDPSLQEVIALVNNVPLVPNQAALEDKGKTPVRAELVIATSNTKNLNAPAYFSCPLAVQRRLPWVVTVRPRKEFARDDAPDMIDPLKIPRTEGEWPDLWDIVVEKVVPAPPVAGRDFATHEVVAKFSNTPEFLDWYRSVIQEFKLVQDKAMNADRDMAQIKMCPGCYKTASNCVCGTLQALALPEGKEYGQEWTEESVEDSVYEKREYFVVDGDYHVRKTTISSAGKRVIVTPATFQEKHTPSDDALELSTLLEEVITRTARTQIASERARWCFSQVLSVFFRLYRWSPLFRNVVARAAQWKVARQCGGWLIVNSNLSIREKCGAFGSLVASQSITPYWAHLIAGITLLAGAWAAVSFMKTKETKVVESQSVQGQSLSKVSMEVDDSYFQKSSEENVWKRQDYETTTFDYDPISTNYATLGSEEVQRKIHRNCARITCRAEGRMAPGNAFCVGGHLWVTNNHILHSKSTKEVELKVDGVMKGTSANVRFTLHEEDVLRMEEADLAFFEVFATDARADLTRLVAKDTLRGTLRGALLGYNADMTKAYRTASGVHVSPNYCAKLGRYFDYWMAKMPQDTVTGDCGSVLISTSPIVTILGLHQLGGVNQNSFSVPLTQTIVNTAREHFKRPLIQSAAPRINYKNTNKVLGELKYSSPLRWLTEGSVKVYGSFIGWTHQPRSKVASTLLGDEIKAERNWTIDVGCPDLSDWRPWHLAVKDVVQQEDKISGAKLRKCSSAYVGEILKKLPDGALSNLRILSDNAAVNGIPGVKYVDKMNFNTSMGEPYNHGKKWHLVAAPTEEQPDAKTFDPTVWEEVRLMEARYKQGVRSSTIFSGQVKDEPRDLKKIALGKLRIFLGASAVFSIVMRKYLLTFVKIVQENTFVFEAAPGVVAQSIQWDLFRDHLTQFGEDRLVAGDYGKFDKKMSAKVILEAFHIIVQILRAAGWSEEDLLVVHGIGEDIAYPYVNLNGDLVQFFGSNPSGHPLTVIINSLVNSLYLRYAFLSIVNDEEKLFRFQDYAKVLTYGDDNVYNVSSEVEEFNHTSIAKMLATIGVEYTMADKESESVPFIHIDDVSFLKRKWRKEPELDTYVCPLEEASIRKMLCVGVRGKTLSPEMHMVTVMTAALNEWFWYGRDRFEKERAYLLGLVHKHHLGGEYELAPFPTWDQLVQRYWKASERIDPERSGAALASSK